MKILGLYFTSLDIKNNRAIGFPLIFVFDVQMPNKYDIQKIPALVKNPHFTVFLCFRDELFKKSLAKLREDIVRANGLVREANFLAEEMGKETEFKVTLQIPAANLSPNRKVGFIYLFIN